MTKSNAPGRTKTLLVFFLTLILGFALFVIPDVFFGVTKINGGKTGVNLLYIALFQFFSVTALLYGSLKILKKDFSFIGLRFVNVKKDLLLGLFFGLLWAVLQFTVFIPKTGGAERADVRYMLDLYDGSLAGTLSLIALGVIGGGITEELYNRGFFINVLRSVFKNPTVGWWVSGVLSVLFFAVGHLPSNAVEWFDILVPTTIYTLLFIRTGRLTASMVAHGIYNMSAILLVHYLYL